MRSQAVPKGLTGEIFEVIFSTPGFKTSGTFIDNYFILKTEPEAKLRYLPL